MAFNHALLIRYFEVPDLLSIKASAVILYKKSIQIVAPVSIPLKSK